MIRRRWANPARMHAELTAEEFPTTPPDWMLDGRCAPIGGRDWDAIEHPEQVVICGGCPVVDDCREYGIEHVRVLDKSGTVLYGGLLPGQIVDEAKRRRDED